MIGWCRGGEKRIGVGRGVIGWCSGGEKRIGVGRGVRCSGGEECGVVWWRGREKWRWSRGGNEWSEVK